MYTGEKKFITLSWIRYYIYTIYKGFEKVLKINSKVHCFERQFIIFLNEIKNLVDTPIYKSNGCIFLYKTPFVLVLDCWKNLFKKVSPFVRLDTRIYYSIVHLFVE